MVVIYSQSVHFGFLEESILPLGSVSVAQWKSSVDFSGVFESEALAGLGP